MSKHTGSNATSEEAYDNSRELIEAETAKRLVDAGNVIAAFRDFDEVGQKEVSAHNFDGTQDNQLRLTSLARGGDADSGGDNVNHEFAFMYWYCHLVSMVNDETGEVSEVPRTVLIDEIGQAMQFVSYGVFQSLRVILSFKGTGKLAEPIRVLIKQRKTRKGWKVLYLEPIVGAQQELPLQ